MTLELMDERPSWSARERIGVMSPLGVATATEISIESFRTDWPVYDIYDMVCDEERRGWERRGWKRVMVCRRGGGQGAGVKLRGVK
jgi:hypothetical protein